MGAPTTSSVHEPGTGGGDEGVLQSEILQGGQESVGDGEGEDVGEARRVDDLEVRHSDERSEESDELLVGGSASGLGNLVAEVDDERRYEGSKGWAADARFGEASEVPRALDRDLAVQVSLGIGEEGAGDRLGRSGCERKDFPNEFGREVREGVGGKGDAIDLCREFLSKRVRSRYV